LRQSVTECAASAATANLHATKPKLSMAAEPLKTCTAYSMFYAAGQLYAHICISRIPVHACILGKPSNDLKSSIGPSMSVKVLDKTYQHWPCYHVVLSQPLLHMLAMIFCSVDTNGSCYLSLLYRCIVFNETLLHVSTSLMIVRRHC